MNFEDERTISDYFNRHRRTSLRRAEIRFGCTKSSIQRNLRNTLHFFQCRLHIIQVLEQRDYEAHIAFSNRYIAIIELDASFLDRVVLSGEFVCYVDGQENKHNIMIWRSGNTYETDGVSRNSDNIAVWCALTIDHVICPFYFDKSIVNRERESQLSLLSTFFLPILPDLPSNINLQQDGAPSH